MPTPIFAPGYLAGVSIFVTGESGAEDVNVTGWDWEERINAILTTHTGSGGVAERIRGVLDGSGLISFNYDLANIYHLSPWSIVAGAIGEIYLYVSETSFFTIPFIIEAVPYKTVVDGKVEVQARFLLNGAAGTYIRPPS